MSDARSRTCSAQQRRPSRRRRAARPRRGRLDAGPCRRAAGAPDRPPRRGAAKAGRCARSRRPARPRRARRPRPGDGATIRIGAQHRRRRRGRQPSKRCLTLSQRSPWSPRHWPGASAEALRYRRRRIGATGGSTCSRPCCSRRTTPASAPRVRAVDESRACPKATCSVRVEYSTLNYKDALAITNQRPGRAQLADGRRHRRRRHGARERRHPALEGRATASSTTAGASARRTGAAWPSARA